MQPSETSLHLWRAFLVKWHQERPSLYFIYQCLENIVSQEGEGRGKEMYNLDLHTVHFHKCRALFFLTNQKPLSICMKIFLHHGGYNFYWSACLSYESSCVYFVMSPPPAMYTDQLMYFFSVTPRLQVIHEDPLEGSVISCACLCKANKGDTRRATWRKWNFMSMFM